MAEIFSVSSAFRQEIAAAEKKVEHRLGSGLALCETIVLPDFGQHIILRFELAQEIPSLAEIDHIETSLKEIVGPEYWAALVGAAFRRVLPPHFLADLPARLAQLSPLLAGVPWPDSASQHAPRIRKDAEIIRSHLKLGPKCRIWEIESPFAENDTPTIRIIGGIADAMQPGFVSIGHQQFEVELLPGNDTYETLLRVYGLAFQNRKALLHYLYEQTGTS